MVRYVQCFVNNISEEDINKLYKDYDSGLYDNLLNTAHKSITIQQKRQVLVIYLEYFINIEDNDDERKQRLSNIVNNQNIPLLIAFITTDQFYQEPLYRFVS
jgi:hypothetical protein